MRGGNHSNFRDSSLLPLLVPNRFPLGPELRLKKRAEFSEIQGKGPKFYTKHFLVLVSPGRTPVSRIGITVTTKIDKRSVARNKLKRRIREIFRLNRYRLRSNFDIVVIARQSSVACSYEDIRREIIGALRYNGFLDKQTDER